VARIIRNRLLFEDRLSYFVYANKGRAKRL